MKLFFPDTFYIPEQISASSFLYFNKDKNGFTLHPSVSVSLNGVNPFKFSELVNNKKPEWLDDFNFVFNLWYQHNQLLRKTDEIIAPLKGIAFKSIWMVYPQNDVALEESSKIIDSTGLDIKAVSKYIDPYLAADEFIAHILFEKFLEIYHADKSPEQIFNMGKKEPSLLPDDFDYTELFNYCNKLFSSEPLTNILTKSYLFRMPALKNYDNFILSNERLLEFLNYLPITESQSISQKEEVYLDVIAWELFRQILSKDLDVVDNKRVAIILKLLKKRTDEIDKLKSKCLELSSDFYGEKNYDHLKTKIMVHVKTKIEKEIKELLEIDNASISEYLSTVFSDEKSWIAISAFIVSLFTGGQIITAGSAIAGLANLGAKAFKVAFDNNKKIKSSDYKIIYRIRNELK